MTARKAALIALATGIGGVVTMALSTGAAFGSPQHHDAKAVQTLNLTIRYTDIVSRFVGKDANHPSVGDEFVDATALRAHGAVIGHATNICTIVSGDSEATFITQCAGTFTLARGEIVTAGADDSSDRTTDAVTGGTGAFSYASGTATTVSGPASATVTIRYLTAR